MYAKKMFSATLLVLISISLAFPLQTARSQGKKPSQGSTASPPATRTRLEVEEFGGEFQQWVKALTINSAGKVTFRWTTDQPGVAAASWQVSDKPVSSSSQILEVQAPNVIAGGALSVIPEPGHVAAFDIDFAKFAPGTPPTSPRSYWVFVKTKNSRQQPVGVISNAVKVTYRASTQPPVDFSGIPAEKPTPMPIVLHLAKFTVNKTNEGEGDDDPYLFVVAIYADGTTVKPLDLAHSSVRLASPAKTHNNLLMDAYDNEPRKGKSYTIPLDIGRFETGVLPLSGLPASLIKSQMHKTMSRVGILVVVMDEDNTETDAAKAARKALVNNLQKELDGAVRSMKEPDIAALQKKITDEVVSAAKKETLSNWWAPWGLFDVADPDDFIGVNFATFSYAQIANAGLSGLPISLVCESGQGSYTITGSISRK
jgi:hypothetical protein